MSLITVELLRQAIPSTLKEITLLKLDYKNILRIDNLWRFNRLTKLQLENNKIEKIEGLEQLVNLKWLDLSYNKIKDIEGLNSLTELRTLSLKSNRVSVLENMNNLKHLELFSISYNNIESYDRLLYLRKFKNLNCLVFEGNPIINTEEDDYKEQVLVRLPFLKYLDYEIVTPNMVQNSKEKYGFKTKDVEEREETERLREKASRDGSEKLESYRKAFIVEFYENRLCETFFQPYKNIFAGEERALTNDVKDINEKQIEIALDSHQRRHQTIGLFETLTETINTKARREITREIQLRRENDDKFHFWMKLNEIEDKRGDEIHVLTTLLLRDLCKNLIELQEHFSSYICSISEKIEILNHQVTLKESQILQMVFSSSKEKLNELTGIIQSRADKWFRDLSTHFKWLDSCQNRENVALFLN